MFFIFWTSHGITHTPIPDLVQLSAQFSPEQQFLCFPKQRVARGKESVSNPSPNNTRDPAKRAKFLANCGSINPPYRTVLATCGDTLLALEPINQIVPTTARASHYIINSDAGSKKPPLSFERLPNIIPQL